MSSFQEKVRRFFKNKLVLCCVGSLIFWVSIYLYCAFTGNDYEPKANRPEQESIGKLCDFFVDLKKFGAPAKSGDAWIYYVDHEIDGFKPSMEKASIKTFSSPKEIKDFYLKSCKRLGFELDRENINSKFDFSCTNNKENSTLITTPKCNSKQCEILLELQSY